MKKAIIKITATTAMVIFSFGLFAQTPPHPNGGGGPGSGNTPVGGGAPVGGGLIIMLALGMGYGGKKVFDMRRKISE